MMTAALSRNFDPAFGRQGGNPSQSFLPCNEEFMMGEDASTEENKGMMRHQNKLPTSLVLPQSPLQREQLINAAQPMINPNDSQKAA